MKKIFAILLCLILVFALAACGKDVEPTVPSTPGNTSTNAPTGAPTDPTDAPTEPVTEPGESETAPTTEPTEPSAEPTEPPTEPHVHAFGEWGISIAPSCESEGVKERDCACGEKETEPVSALGHNYVDGEYSLCGMEDPNYPKSAHLVMSYERAVTSYNVLGVMAYGYRFDFTYDSDYRSGTVTLTAQERETRYGTFTCDEKYTINHIEFNDAAGILVINAALDEQYRTCLIEMKSVIDGAETLEYLQENDYDDRGFIIRQRYCTAFSGDTIQENVCDDTGKLHSAAFTINANGVISNMYLTREYDENGYMKADRYVDADGNIVMETLYEHEIQGDLVQYSYVINGAKRTETHDQNGKVVGTGYYTDDKNYQIVDNFFNENGDKMVKRVITMAVDGTIYTQTEEMTYLPDGRKVEHTESDGVQTAIFEKTTYQEVEIPR